MRRLTITLSDEKYQALRETAAKTGKTIRRIIEESLELAGIKTTDEARRIVARARARSGLTEAAALRLANQEVKASRRR